MVKYTSNKQYVKSFKQNYQHQSNFLKESHYKKFSSDCFLPKNKNKNKLLCYYSKEYQVGTIKRKLSFYCRFCNYGRK